MGSAEKPPRKYWVQPGDTLYTICKRHSVTRKEVLALNEVANPNIIKAGSTLLIPNNEPEPANILEGIGNRIGSLKSALEYKAAQLKASIQQQMTPGGNHRNAAEVTAASTSGPALEQPEEAPKRRRGRGKRERKEEEAHNESLLAMWNEINTDGDHRLSREELKQYANNKFLPETYIVDFLSEADTDRSGCVDFDEFKAYVEGKEIALRKAFDGIDADRTGYIDIQEMESAFRVLVVEGKSSGYGSSNDKMSDTRYRIPDRAIKELMTRLDYDGNGELDFNEFRAFFAMIPRSELEYLTPYWRKSAMDFGSGYTASHLLGLKGEQGGLEGSPWAHLFSGGIAGAVAKSCTAPLETIRVRMMVGAEAKGPVMTAQQIFRDGGLGGFFRGNVVGSLSAMPSKGICFLSFEMIKNLIAKDRKLTNTELLVAGAAAGAITEVVIHPTSLLSHRMMVEKSYKGIGDCLAKTVRTEGVKGLWASGLWPSVLGIIPFTLMSYGVYDILEKKIEDDTGKPVSLGTKMALGMFASWAGMTAASPLSVVRTRLMTQNLTGNAAASTIYKGVTDCFVRVYREEGPAAFYKGLGVASLRMLPVGGISRGTYEGMQMAITALDEQLLKMKHVSELRALTQSSK